MYEAAVTVPSNIALVKYWGKRDKGLNLPANGSLSVTFGGPLSTTTAYIPGGEEFRVYMVKDCREVDIQRGPTLPKRTTTVVSLFNEILKAHGLPELRGTLITQNTFPTGAGLASSASGYAAMVKALALALPFSVHPNTLSCIARQGSGSATRSMDGGFMLWDRGEREDGSDSLARRIESPLDLSAIVYVFNTAEKAVSSAAGMVACEGTVAYEERVKNVAPRHLAEAERLVASGDWHNLCPLIMRDSDSFHAVCAESGITYLSDASRILIEAVREVRDLVDVAYTFDAGENGVVLCKTADLDFVRLQMHKRLVERGVKASVLAVHCGAEPRSVDVPSEFREILQAVDDLASGLATH